MSKFSDGQGRQQVTQYKIPAKGRLVEFTLSYRGSDGAFWRPILEKIKRTVVIAP